MTLSRRTFLVASAAAPLVAALPELATPILQAVEIDPLADLNLPLGVGSWIRKRYRVALGWWKRHNEDMGTNDPPPWCDLREFADSVISVWGGNIEYLASVLKETDCNPLLVSHTSRRIPPIG